MSEQPRTRLGTISIWLGAIPSMALISWFAFYSPCGSLRRTIIEGVMFWGTIVAVPFGIFASVREKPRKRALIGLSLGLVPLVFFVLIAAGVIYAVATGGRGFPGILEVSYSAANGTPMTFETGVFVTTDTTYYDVKGSTLEELDAQVASLGPRGFIAETVPSYRWNYTYRTEDGSCRIDRVRVDTKIVFTYPRWNDPAADRAVAGEWGRRLDRLQKHEGEHEGIARKAGQEIYDNLVRIPPAPSCGELEKEIETRAQAVIAKEREANDEFDSVTGHGNRPAEAVP